MKLAALARMGALIAVRRTAADWRLQLAAVFGMVLAVALMSAAVIYSNALRETALRYALRNADDRTLHMIVGESHALDPALFLATRDVMERRIHGPLRPYIDGASLQIETSTLLYGGRPEFDLPDSQRHRGPVYSLTDVQEHLEVVAGRLPQPAGGELEVVIDQTGASTLGLGVGDRFNGLPAVSEGRPALPIHVVGIVAPVDPEHRVWQLGFASRFTRNSGAWTTLPLYTDGRALFDTVAPAFPGLYTNYRWSFYVDRENLRAGDAQNLRTLLPQVRRNVFGLLSIPSWNTELEGVLDRFVFLLTLARIPLFLLVFLAIGVLLYYLFLIAGLMGRVRASEVAVFRSRGASTPQVGLLILLEGLLLAVPAVVVGPFLAQGLVILTGRVLATAGENTDLAFVTLTPEVFLLGGVGALLAVGVLTATTLGSSRKGVVEFGRAEARPPDQLFLHRYYLDVALIGLMGLLWWQLKTRDSVLIQPLAASDVQIDITLLLGPVLGTVAAGLVLLRFFPLAMRAVAWLTEPWSPVWLVQGIRRVARDPVPAGSLLVLLGLATSLGVLSSAFITTLERSQEERALYAAGADFRVGHNLGSELASGRSPAEELVANSPPGVAAADVMRLSVGAMTAGFGRGATLLAVDGDEIGTVAWSRPDFAGEPLSLALTALEPENVATGLPLPEDAVGLEIWAAPGMLPNNTVLRARLQDGKGTFFDATFAALSEYEEYREAVTRSLSGNGWRFLEAQFPLHPYSTRRGPQPPLLEEPFTLHTLWVNTPQGDTSGAIFLDDLKAKRHAGAVEVASFQELGDWHPLENPAAPGLAALEVSETVGRSGRKSVVYTWGVGRAPLRGIQVGPAGDPVPALASTSFLESNEVQVGDVITFSVESTAVAVELVGGVAFFPTLDPRTTEFLVADLDSLLLHANLQTLRRLRPSAELWVRDGSGTMTVSSVEREITYLGGEANSVHDAAEMVATRTSDPLLTAGWAGLLALSFLTVVLASSSGLLLYTYIDARERQGEFAMLRSLGFSRLQVNGVVWFNLVLVVALGLGIGTWGGQWLGATLLPLLEVAEGGTRVTPPMVLETNWSTLGLAYAILMAATAATVVALAWAISRLDLQRLLRVEGG